MSKISKTNIFLHLWNKAVQDIFLTYDKLEHTEPHVIFGIFLHILGIEDTYGCIWDEGVFSENEASGSTLRGCSHTEKEPTVYLI